MFKPRQAASAVPATPPTIEVIRQRAKHRLIGASLLVLAGVVVFPMLFDTQPRPISVDIPIEIPSREVAKLPGKVAADKSLAQQEEVVVSQGKPLSAPAAPVPAQTDVLEAETKATQKLQAKPELKVETKDAISLPPKVQATPVAPPTKESERAEALLEGRSNAPKQAENAAEAQGASERFIVQVGAFAENALAQEARFKLERVGLKTYTHVAETPAGKRIRVRLGPFSSRVEAEKAATKAKGLGLAAAILTL